MTKILLSPEIPDYFVEMDWREGGGGEAFSKKLVTRYEAGDVILLRNAPVAPDYDVLNRISLPPGREYQKTSDFFFLYPNIFRPRDFMTVWRAVKGDPGLYLAFRREVARISGDLRRLGHALFKPYRFLTMGLNWRFTETQCEDLHIDGYGVDDDVQFVRIFMNLDQAPRRWNVSYRLDELAPRYYGEAGMANAIGASADSFNKKLNLHVFGGKERIGRDGFPRHKIEFAQGDLWLCDSRIVSHQIVWGRRLVATHFRAETASMRNPKMSLENRVRDFHSQAQLAASD